MVRDGALVIQELLHSTSIATKTWVFSPLMVMFCSRCLLRCQRQEFIFHFEAKLQACTGLVITFASRLSAEVECYCYPWLSIKGRSAIFQKTWSSALPSWKRPGLATGSGGAPAGVSRAGIAFSRLLSVAILQVKNRKKSSFLYNHRGGQWHKIRVQDCRSSETKGFQRCGASSRDALWLGLCWVGEQTSQFPLALFLMIFHSLCALI